MTDTKRPGRRIVRISPTMIQGLLTEGWEIGNGHIIRCRGGLPTGARFVRGWYDGSQPGDGQFCLLFEHDDWEPVPEGELYPDVPVTHEIETVPTVEIRNELSGEQCRPVDRFLG